MVVGRRERFEWNADTDGPLHAWHRQKQSDGWMWDVHVPTVRTRNGFIYEFTSVEDAAASSADEP